MKTFSFILTSLFLYPLCLLAHVAGAYSISGFDPTTNQEYTGTLKIDKKGELFTGLWTFNDGTSNTGTGVRKGSSISFVFFDQATNHYGVQNFEIHDHEKKLKGPWTLFETDVKGFEKAESIDK